MMWSRRALTILAVLHLQAMPAFAAKTDIVVLLNGDRITCEVTVLSQGELQIKTDDAGTILIDWAKVASVSTADQFDVATKDGRRFVGRLQPAPSAGQLSVVDISGGATVMLPVLDVVSFARLRASFLQRIDGSVNLGGSYTQASEVGQLTFDGTASYRRPSFLTTVRASAAVTFEERDRDTERYSLQGGYIHFRPNRWLVSWFALFERNPDLGFDLRGTTGLSAGRYFVQTNRGWLLVAGGISYGREVPIDTSTQTNVDAIVTIDASLFVRDFPNTDIDFSTFVFRSLNDGGRVRVNSQLSIRRELIRDLKIGLSAYEAYDSRPPSVEADNNDVGISLTIGWSF